MAKWCPITGEKVLYLECLECDDKICKNPKQEMCIRDRLMDHGMPFPEAKNTLFDLLTKDDAEILAVSNSIFPGSKKYVVGCCR